ncbi:MAG: sulfite exporter TauE/SafE family protein [Xanthomonadales bacterium]|nr:sulfite exporter TauE/SafE family protein [Xanthomonadales bacterium]
MPIDLLTLSAAALTGLLGSVHCLLMCSGVATSLAAASDGGTGREAAAVAVSLNLGRVLGYAAAGALIAGLGAGVVHAIDVERLAWMLRLGVGAVLVLVGLRLLDGRDRLRAVAGVGQRAWRRLQPLGRRLLPATTLPRRLALGALWGWLPCGLSWSMLLVALFTVDAVNGALTMAAFGVGTLPAVLPLTWGSARLARRLSRPGSRRGLGLMVVLAGALTLAAPWLAQVPALHSLLGALGCRTLPGA